jgi:4-diphosphocytidyl-2-C-methyl-D-erythritol kinase
LEKAYKIKSSSKINLGLKVLNLRNDNYHNINSIFIEIDLYDIITFIPSNSFSLTCSNNNITINEENTIVKAYEILNKKFNFQNHYKILLEKNIPISGGMGGGSSNAAFTLKALNKLNNLKLTNQQLCKISLNIGSDVPFFIEGRVKLVSGRGEIISNHNAPLINTLYILLIFPDFSVNTSWAYKKIKNKLQYKKYSTKFPALDSKVNWKLFENDFEDIVGSAYPEIFEIKKFLYDNGALYSGLSGSGSTMFGVYNDKNVLEKIKQSISHYNTLIVSPV